jgi:hypothetical protein
MAPDQGKFVLCKLNGMPQSPDNAPGVTSAMEFKSPIGPIARRLSVASKKTILTENVQEYLEKSDWKAAVMEMEKLFAISQDPLIRVRIGDTRLKLNRKQSAIREYLRAAALFSERGFVVKALAQYRLVLRLDASNAYARSKVEKMRLLRSRNSATKPQREPMEYHVPQPLEDAFPQYV